MIDPITLLTLLRQSVRLKWLPRTGWLLRGVADPESVAEHSWGVALLALFLADAVDEPLERDKLLTIALIHDLPEAVLSDIPTPAAQFFPPTAKREAEEAVLTDLLAPLSEAERLLGWWREFEEGSSPEGRLVQDADRLEMLLQALMYEESRGARLDEFWEWPFQRPLHFAASRALLEALEGQRMNRSAD